MICDPSSVASCQLHAFEPTIEREPARDGGVEDASSSREHSFFMALAQKFAVFTTKQTCMRARMRKRKGQTEKRQKQEVTLRAIRVVKSE